MKVSAQTPRRFLYNDTALYSLFEQLQQADSQVVSILHLGDSHVQAGFLPEATGSRLKEKFGDAGPGWVFPYNLGGTNGPDSYRWSSPLRWSADRVVDKSQAYWPGPGGMVISTSQSSPSLSFIARQGSFDCIKVFYDAGAGKAPVQMGSATIVQDAAMRPGERSHSGIALENGEQVTTTPEPVVTFPESGQQTAITPEHGTQPGALPGNGQQSIIKPDTSVSTFRLSWPQHTGGPFRFYGAILQSGQHGIHYHAIGINGAQFMHYNQHEATLPVQLGILRPQLLILSLGTNEAFGGITAAQLRQEMDRTMNAVRQYAPGAKVLFTTPPYGMKKKRQAPYRKNKRTYYRVTYLTNPQVAVLRAEILQYCRDNGYACWDFYEAMRTDKRFLRAWSNDRVHFNAYGYTLQGTLLFEAIAAAYDEWIKN